MRAQFQLQREEKATNKSDRMENVVEFKDKKRKKGFKEKKRSRKAGMFHFISQMKFKSNIRKIHPLN